MNSKCPLCSNSGFLFFKNEKITFYQCVTCKGIFADKKLRLSSTEEKDRYKHHKNNINDIGYINFADPIISTVKKYFNSDHQGLDFGVGHTPVLSEILKAQNYNFEIYDPLFFDRKEVLKNEYDFITCCEVIEHFYDPFKEFKLLHNLLIPGGKLICMTFLYHKGIVFNNWFYKNDPTHVFLYQNETIYWIKEHYNFDNVKIHNRLIVFTK